MIIPFEKVQPGGIDVCTSPRWSVLHPRYFLYKERNWLLFEFPLWDGNISLPWIFHSLISSYHQAFPTMSPSPSRVSSCHLQTPTSVPFPRIDLLPQILFLLNMIPSLYRLTAFITLEGFPFKTHGLQLTGSISYLSSLRLPSIPTSVCFASGFP